MLLFNPLHFADNLLGRAYVEKLAAQGLNVLIVALDDDLLHSSHREMEEKYPDLEFRKVGVNLGATDPDVYMVRLLLPHLSTYERNRLRRRQKTSQCKLSSVMQVF